MSLPACYQPQNLQITPGVGVASIALAWNPVSGSVVVGYNVRRDGQLLNTGGPITAATYTDTAVKLGRHYAYQVSAVDGSGNESPATPIQRVELLQGVNLDWEISWVEQPGMAGRPDVAWSWH